MTRRCSRRRRREQVRLSEVWGHSQHSSEGPLDSFQSVFAVLQGAASASIAETAADSIHRYEYRKIVV